MRSELTPERRELALTRLRELSALLADPVRWTQGANARNYDGAQVGTFDDDATCWCLNGGLLKVCDARSATVLPNDFWDAARLLGLCAERMKPAVGQSFSSFNDRSNHEEVKLVIGCAIERAQKEKEEEIKSPPLAPA